MSVPVPNISSHPGARVSPLTNAPHHLPPLYFPSSFAANFLATQRTNVLGPLQLTQHLLSAKLLNPFSSGRLPVVLNISSSSGSITGNHEMEGESRNPAYCLSKSTLTYMGVLLGKELRGKVVIGSVHP